MVFKNRQDAGEQLAKKLFDYKDRNDVVVLALPRGGVVTGFEVVRVLKTPFDIVVPRKIGHPFNDEYTIGAITETGEGIFDESEVKQVDSDWLKKEIAKEKKEATRRRKTYRGDKEPVPLKNKVVILVDDGIATGMTMRAAIETVKKQQPKEIVVAIPVIPKDSLHTIKKIVDHVVYVDAPLLFGAIGSFYETFDQTNDAEVIDLMNKAAHV